MSTMSHVKTSEIYHDAPVWRFYRWFFRLPIERFIALSMAAMALGIAGEPNNGVAGYINHTFANSTSYDFALMLALSALFLFCYHRDQSFVYTMTLPLWAYMLLTVPYTLSASYAPPVLPIISVSYLYLVSRVLHHHRVTGYYAAT